MDDDNTCKGWNYHVFPLFADRCVICGAIRYPKGSDE